MSSPEKEKRALTRSERSCAMSAIGVALGAISMLPDQRMAEKERAKKEAKQQALVSKKKKQSRVREGLLQEQMRTKKERTAESSSIKNINSRLSVFDKMLQDRPVSPELKRGTEVDSFGSVSTPEIS